MAQKTNKRKVKKEANIKELDWDALEVAGDPSTTTSGGLSFVGYEYGSTTNTITGTLTITHSDGTTQVFAGVSIVVKIANGWIDITARSPI
jgi:hypothetical protein